MKRKLQFEQGDDLKFIATAKFLIECMVDFEAHYKANGESTIEFECEDHVYEYLLEDVPRIYREFTH